VKIIECENSHQGQQNDGTFSIVIMFPTVFIGGDRHTCAITDESAGRLSLGRRTVVLGAACLAITARAEFLA